MLKVQPLIDLGDFMFASLKYLVILFTFIFCYFSQTEAANLPITSEFGWRIHPITGEYKFHAGVDLGYDYGTPVATLFDCVVVMAGDYNDGYGKQVLMYHTAYDVYTRYAHLQAVYVTVGSELVGNTLVGEVGSTGNSTGPHLHLEYMARDSAGNYIYVDPLCLF